MFSVKGKKAVITGATSGLGMSAAKAFSAAGADVAALGRRYDRLVELERSVNRKNGRILPVRCDITSQTSVSASVQTIIQEFGRIDILINNSGIIKLGSVETMSEEEWQSVYDVNVKGMYHMCHEIIPLMKEQKYGKIINISSLNASVTSKADTDAKHAYNSSKAAVKGFTIGLAATYMKYGITVNAVSPGLFRTEMTMKSLAESRMYGRTYEALNPAGRLGNEGELNGTLIYLASDASSYVTGQCIGVDGGASFVFM